MMQRRQVLRYAGGGLATWVLAAAAGAAFAQRGDDRGGHDRGGHERGRPGGPPGHVAPGSERGRWFDGAHGHNHAYPTPGFVVRVPPPRASVVFWSGVGYRFWDGIWYAPGPGGYVVVRPPYGVVVRDVPPFFTALTIAGVAYLYANGVYYREAAGGSYEVVPPPVEGAAGTRPDKAYVYPRNGQAAQQQATDEYECHRWAFQQTGYDPTGAATGQSAAAPRGQARDYERARSACLEGRGYTVR